MESSSSEKHKFTGEILLTRAILFIIKLLENVSGVKEMKKKVLKNRGEFQEKDLRKEPRDCGARL